MNLKVANYDTVMFHDGGKAAEALEEEHDYDIASKVQGLRDGAEDYIGETRTVDVHIGQLRKKLSLNDNIKTISKMGYRL